MLPGTSDFYIVIHTKNPPVLTGGREIIAFLWYYSRMENPFKKRPDQKNRVPEAKTLASGEQGAESQQSYGINVLRHRIGMAEGHVPHSDSYQEPTYEKTERRKSALEKLQYLFHRRNK